MASIHTTADINGPSCCIASAVNKFEAGAYDFLDAFNQATPQTQDLILNDYVPADPNGMSVPFGAATLFEALNAMLDMTTSADVHSADGALIAAAELFEATADVFLQAVGDVDQDTRRAINQSLWSFDPPAMHMLDLPSTAAWMARAVNEMTQTDVVSFTIGLWGGQNGCSLEHLPDRAGTAKATSTEMTTGNKLGSHVAYYESVHGLPLIVGPFPDYDAAWQYIDGDNVVDVAYDRAWVQPITTPDVDAQYPTRKLPGQCQAFGCDQPGTTRHEREQAVTVLCDECSEHLG